MSDVFILGAGFSRAISPMMPLTSDLSKEVVDRYKHAGSVPAEVGRMIEEDFEKALTFLSQQNPDLTEDENLRQKSLYRDLTTVIRGVIWEKSWTPVTWGSNTPLLWLEHLLSYWHEHRSVVLTLNYDTLVERVASAFTLRGRTSFAIPTGQLYPIPFTPVGDETKAGNVNASSSHTFALYKLHGSINWFCRELSKFSHEPLFYVPCVGGVDHLFERPDAQIPGLESLKKMQMLIVPPVLDKTPFLEHSLLQSMWGKAAEALQCASRVVCLGYSLPATDLTVVRLLRNRHPQSRIPFQIVDVAPRKSTHFTQVLGKAMYQFKQSPAELDCIPRWVIKNCIPNRTDMIHVVRMTPWRSLISILRDECLPELGSRWKYFSITTIRQWLQKHKLSSSPATVTRYLHDLIGKGVIFGAGRGWYSSLATPFTLNREPVSSLVQELNKTFPLLDFSCWSTAQIASYAHHLLAKFVSFIHTERDSMESVFEFLRDQGFNAHLNPRGTSASQFSIRERTVVVRPKVTTQPVEEHFVTIEGLLVDLFVESRSLALMDAGECLQVFRNATGQGRISMARVVDYARRSGPLRRPSRQPAADQLLESIKTGFSTNAVLIDSD